MVESILVNKPDFEKGEFSANLRCSHSTIWARQGMEGFDEQPSILHLVMRTSGQTDG
jgi:hypothetical protein